MVNIKSKAEMKDIFQVSYILQKRPFMISVATWIFDFLLGIGVMIYSIFNLQNNFNYFALIALIFSIVLIIISPLAIRKSFQKGYPKTRLNALKKTNNYMLEGISFDYSLDKEESILKDKTAYSESVTKINNKAVNAIIIMDKYIYFNIAPIVDAFFHIEDVTNDDLNEIKNIFGNKVIDKRNH